MPKVDPLAVPCPKCNAGVGARCRNYKNRPCAPHRQRKPVHIPNVQPAEVYADGEATRRAVAGKHATELARAVSACGWFPGATYGRWTFRDRTGARPDVVVYRCYRPGVPRGHEEYAADFPGHAERLGPPFVAFYTNRPGGDDSPGGFGLRWESSWGSIEVPAVRTAAELRAAAEKRRAKAVARQAADAAALAEWKRKNEPPSLFDVLDEPDAGAAPCPTCEGDRLAYPDCLTCGGTGNHPEAGLAQPARG